MLSKRTFGLGLGAAALLSLITMRPAQASGLNYDYGVTFSTPSPFLGTGNGDVLFVFSPDGPNPAPASITASNLTYSNDWKINPFGITTFGDTSINFFSQAMTINNTDAANGFSVPVSQWGSSFGFDLNYQDPPGTDPSDFKVVLQKAGLADDTLFAVRFDPAGKATLLENSSGAGFTPQGNTPILDVPGTPSVPGTPPVPEASSVLSLGLLLALGTGGCALQARKRRTA